MNKLNMGTAIAIGAGIGAAFGAAFNNISMGVALGAGLGVAFGAALTGLITFSYGFLENISFPKFPTFFVFPMLIAIWGISLGYFGRRYR